MKVLCIKDTIGFTKWEVYEAVCDDKCLYGYKDNYINWTENLDYFQEVKEEKIKPKWKLGDYVVIDSLSGNHVYSFIRDMCVDSTGSIDGYNYSIDSKTWTDGSKYRKPTQEELDLYFNKI